MTSLKWIHIYYDHSNDYRLSPHDLSLFKHLPLTEIDIEALDLDEYTIPIFRDLFEEMGAFDNMIDRLDEMMPP